MATVLGELTLEFTGATVIHIVEVPLEPHVTTTLADTGPTITLWLLGLDLPPLAALWGPLVDLSWKVALVPAPLVVPLPASVWMLGAAVAALAMRARRRA